jgi:glycosyltransferase involved in cell wall biosynthesis
MLVFGGVRRYVELGNAFVSRGHSFVVYTPRGEAPGWIPFSGEVRPLGDLPLDRNDVVISGSPELLGALDRSPAPAKIFYLQIEKVDNEAEIVRSGRYRIMVNSSGLRRRVRRRYRVEPIDGIGGINPAMFHPPAVRSAGDPFRVLCYGRFSRPRKGTRFVVQAVRRLYRRGYNVELHLFDTVDPGDPDPRAGFDPGVPFRFYLNLDQSRMAAMYGAADIFVSAEHRAGWNNTAAEAAACGLPLVCTRSGTEDFAENGVSAIILPGRRSPFIARAIAALYRDRTLAARLGAEGHRRIMRFTWDDLCAKMESAFIGTVADRTVRSRS